MIKNKKIPNFKNIEEEAKFWDTHDIGDFMDDFKIVSGEYKPVNENKTTMTIRLTPSLKKKLKKVASGWYLY